MMDPSVAAKSLPFLEELCKDLPKIELHRHLTGSLPATAVEQLLKVGDPAGPRSVAKSVQPRRSRLSSQ